LFYFCSPITPVDEVKQIGGLINGFILRVHYSRDYEKQLQFYDEARGAFTNIDSVLVQLIQVRLLNFKMGVHKFIFAFYLFIVRVSPGNGSWLRC
jgi:hypothetical protein